MKIQLEVRSCGGLFYCRNFACRCNAGCVVQCVLLTEQRSAFCRHTSFIIRDVAAASKPLVGMGVTENCRSSVAVIFPFVLCGCETWSPTVMGGGNVS